MINVKDLLIYDDKEHFNARNVLRSVLFTHEHKKTSDLLFEMRKSSTNMAIVLDEYGVTAGMVTIEDLLEEIVGDIRDEYDEDEEQLVTRLSDPVSYTHLDVYKRQLLGFGNVLWEGVHDAVQEEGLLGIFKGGLTAGSAGTCAALVFGYLASLVFDSKMKK